MVHDMIEYAKKSELRGKSLNLKKNESSQCQLNISNLKFSILSAKSFE